ncbi:Chondroadherin-like protein like [Argiope bruennichi]|uniref:Chondroadherin-like protein like n=1 Tax=Argiope bruennichi TaxID=94029 RepID=A0A8T0FP14_ARGBR|nr:Chondroadherin-like protein like [Argiope bruennichi]
MIILWFPFFTTLFWPVICTCPPEEDIAPHCICKDLGDGPMMLCNNVMSTDELFPLIKSTDSYDMFALTLMNSALSYIPSDLFKGTQYQKIRFVNTQIMSLSDDDLAFVGLEDRLEELRATDAHYVTQWDWSQLRNHRRLDLIDINLISMHSLDQEFPALKSLTALGLIKAEISFIHPTAFSKLENLQILDMRDNLITELLQFKGNEFLCDCRLKWLVKVGKPFYFQGSCSLPENLNGMSLKDISEKMLRC